MKAAFSQIVILVFAAHQALGGKVSSREWSVHYPKESWPNCTIDERVKGSCEKIVGCNAAVEVILRGYHPPICYWERYQEFPLVCCPSSIKDILTDILPGSQQTVPIIFPVDSNLECGKVPVISRTGSYTRPRNDLRFGNDWPWNVGIYKDGVENKFVQNGFLIDELHVVTTASVLYSEEIIPLNVKFTNGQWGKVVRTVVHEDFKPWVKYNDIAVLKLKEPVNSDSVRAICLPLANIKPYGFAGAKTSVIGTTKTEQVPIVSHSWCAETYSKFSPLSYPRGIDEQFLCGGLQMKNQSLAGIGDAGGAVMIKNKNHWIAVGMVSLDYKCANQGFPGIYMNMGYFKEWIDKTIKTL